MGSSGRRDANPLYSATVIDLLDNALGELSVGRVAALKVAELDDLADAVNAFYEAWEVPELGTDELRFYSGGWIAGNSQVEEARQYLYVSLLYAPSVIVHDPIAEWFYRDRDLLRSPPAIRAARGGMQVQGAEPSLLRGNGYYVFRDEPERSRDFLSRAITGLTILAPLIRKRIVVPIPEWQLVREREQAILTAVRQDVRDETLAEIINGATESPPRGNDLRGAEVVPSGGVAPADTRRAVVQNPAYFLHKTLAIGDATSSRYLPPAAIDARLLEHRIVKLGEELRRKDIDLQVVASLAEADLPFLGSLDPATVASIRQDDDAFEAWRALLRTMVREIESIPSHGDAFAREAREVVNDVLGPMTQELQRASRTRAIAAAREGVVGLGIGAAAATGAVIAGAPAAPTLAVAEISTVGRWLYSSLFGRSPTGAHGVLAKLIRKK